MKRRSNFCCAFGHFLDGARSRWQSQEWLRLSAIGGFTMRRGICNGGDA
jgi:hypothetical protein